MKRRIVLAVMESNDAQNAHHMRIVGEATCATCRYAETPTWDYDTVFSDYLLCERMRQPGHKADVADFLYVLPDFGCVQWEAKG